MPGKIFFRERLKMVDGAKQPRYAVMAVEGIDLKIYGHHFRMSELKQMAESVGAELIHLHRGPKHLEEAA